MNKPKVVLEMPDGWKFLIGASTAPCGFSWVYNGKSLFSGERESALLKIKANQTSLL